MIFKAIKTMPAANSPMIVFLTERKPKIFMLSSLTTAIICKAEGWRVGAVGVDIYAPVRHLVDFYLFYSVRKKTGGHVLREWSIHFHVS